MIKFNNEDIKDTSWILNGIIVKISYINSKPIAIAKGIFLVYWEPASTKSLSLIFKSIITNKNNTAIAPTYKIIYEIPINPIPNRIKYPAALINTEIKNITDITGFLEVITKTLEIRAPKAKISIKRFLICNI